MTGFEGLTIAYQSGRWVQQDVDGAVIFSWNQASNEGKGRWVIDSSLKVLNGKLHAGAFTGITPDKLAASFKQLPPDKLVLPVDIRNNGNIYERTSAVPYLGLAGLTEGTVVYSTVYGKIWYSLYGKDAHSIRAASANVDLPAGLDLGIAVPDKTQILKLAGEAVPGTPLAVVGPTFDRDFADGTMKGMRVGLFFGDKCDFETIATDSAGHLLVLER